MSEKSHVGMAHHVCPVCHKKHGEMVLLSRRLKDEIAADNFMGYALCPEHQAMAGEYVALVEMTGEPGKEESYFTGKTAHVKWEVAEQIIDMPMDRRMPFVWVEEGVVDMLMVASGQQPEQGGEGEAQHGLH